MIDGSSRARKMREAAHSMKRGDLKARYPSGLLDCLIIPRVWPTRDRVSWEDYVWPNWTGAEGIGWVIGWVEDEVREGRLKKNPPSRENKNKNRKQKIKIQQRWVVWANLGSGIVLKIFQYSHLGCVCEGVGMRCVGRRKGMTYLYFN